MGIVGDIEWGMMATSVHRCPGPKRLAPRRVPGYRGKGGERLLRASCLFLWRHLASLRRGWQSQLARGWPFETSLRLPQSDVFSTCLPLRRSPLLFATSRWQGWGKQHTPWTINLMPNLHTTYLYHSCNETNFNFLAFQIELKKPNLKNKKEHKKENLKRDTSGGPKKKAFDGCLMTQPVPNGVGVQHSPPRKPRPRQTRSLAARRTKWRRDVSCASPCRCCTRRVTTAWPGPSVTRLACSARWPLGGDIQGGRGGVLGSFRVLPATGGRRGARRVWRTVNTVGLTVPIFFRKICQNMSKPVHEKKNVTRT